TENRRAIYRDAPALKMIRDKGRRRSEAGLIGAPRIAVPNNAWRSILSSSGHLLSCCPPALLISCDFDLVPANVHAAPATRTLFARIEKVSNTRFTFAQAHRRHT